MKKQYTQPWSKAIEIKGSHMLVSASDPVLGISDKSDEDLESEAKETGSDNSSPWENGKGVW